LVASMTTMLDCTFSSSISARYWDMTQRSTSPLVFPLAGEFFSASSNAFLKLLSLSPIILLMILGPLIKKKVPVSFAVACAINILPVSGGPNIRIQWEALIPMYLKSWRQ
ncbi:hypothetical protein EV421DRAFT_1721734, partial [Armillaria borealis]